ncbi:hypothetical protein ABGB09_22325 [Streptomyces sp. B8F3]|uniref:hypothetical protein n=1 Tax=Streptomyces sp. B8F3 TaxID=3153573 RepID=UPI00325E7288
MLTMQDVSKCFLGREPVRRGLVDRRAMERRTAELDETGIAPHGGDQQKVGMSDRILVMADGTFAGELPAGAGEEDIMRLATRDASGTAPEGSAA